MKIIKFKDHSFHNSQIIEVKESSTDQTFDFLLDYPVNWDNNIFEKRILRFRNITKYRLDEIPFVGPHTILEIIDLVVPATMDDDEDIFGLTKSKIEIITNAGNRIIEFSECELLDTF